MRKDDIQDGDGKRSGNPGGWGGRWFGSLSPVFCPGFPRFSGSVAEEIYDRVRLPSSAANGADWGIAA